MSQIASKQPAGQDRWAMPEPHMGNVRTNGPTYWNQLVTVVWLGEALLV